MYLRKTFPILVTVLFLSLAVLGVGDVYAQDSTGNLPDRSSGNESNIGADEDDGYYAELQEREKKKAELEQKIAAAQQQGRTLANQISYLENQIALTELEQQDTRNQIEETQGQLDLVNTDISDLAERMGNLDESMGSLNTVLSARIRSSYEIGSVRYGFVLDQKNYQRAILHSVYLQTLQKEDNKLMAKMSSLKNLYEEQKNQLESLKQEKEELRAQLELNNQLQEQQKQDLNSQQSSKAWLLAVTQNEEHQYQVLLAQTEEEIRAIRAALVNLGTKIGDVKQGDVIAHLGNTGCSTGAHVHFGYYVNGVATDPLGKLNSGEFIYPLNDPVVTQWFNDPNTRSWYQANFGMDGHNGIDLVDGTVGIGAPILAVADGIAYSVSDSQACWLTGTVGKGVRIDHGDGTKTIYWHVQ